jgi:hypothetical protein
MGVEPEEELCCVCLLRKERPLVSPECLHGMCATCSATHVWRSRQAGTVSCPLCRSRIRRLVPASGEGVRERRLSLDWGGVHFELALAARESVEGCLTSLFGIPAERLKVLGRGGRVVSDLEQLAGQSSRFRLLGTPAHDQLLAHDGAGARAREYAGSASHALWQALVALLHTLWLFFASLVPAQTRRPRRGLHDD